MGPGVEEKVRIAQSLGEMPVCVGYGVATPEHAETIGAYADGVVVGSAIVDRIEAAVFDGRGEHGAPATEAGKAAAVDEVGRFIGDLKKPLRR
jgi:tryptophan synthase alpha chain